MRITFQTQNPNQEIDRRTKINREQPTQRTDYAAGYALDISGTVMDNLEVEGHGKTTEEVMQEAGEKNVALQRDYLTVMSNTLSEEDYKKLEEEGFHPGDMDIETTVTIVDKIKAVLIQSGVTVIGYTDTIDMDTLTEITGSETLAKQLNQAFKEENIPLTENTAKEAVQALKEALDLTEPSDDTVKYMILNKKEPTLENLYLAKYSSLKEGSRQNRGYYREENGYLAKKADDIRWEQLDTQINKIIKDANISDEKSGKETAKWLIESGIPLTKDTLTAAEEIKKIEYPLTAEKLFRSMAMAVSDGKTPKEANPIQEKSLWQQAEDIWKEIDAISEEGMDITARRQMEEIRLRMTIDVNRELLKSGYVIDTSNLEKLVDALKEAENRQNQILFHGQNETENAQRAKLYTDTTDTVKVIPQMPLAIVGKAGISPEEFTLQTVKQEGEALISAYEKANESYETFRTAPRSDLGDSIKTAFNNAETLLKELELEGTDDNKRAVRILGYNRLEITKENISIMKQADQSLRNVVEKMTPAATLNLIREGKNPLTMTVSELDEYLSKREQAPSEEQEKYSRYLYQLEQKNEITEEEKQSYIGIYRLIRQIEKSDGAVIGSLVNQGMELSFKNLLTSLRTYRSKGINVSVNDDFGTMQDIKETDISIDKQIETAYFKELNREIFHHLDGNKIIEIAEKNPDMESMNLESFAEALRETENKEKADKRYLQEQISAYKGLEESETKVLHMLEHLDVPVTMENIIAAREYVKADNKVFRDFRKFLRGEPEKVFKSEDYDSWKESIQKLEENITDREELSKGYQELVQNEQTLLDSMMYDRNEITFADMKSMGLLYKQISFTAKLAERERYDIPVITEDSVMAIHLEIIHGQKDRGKIEASMDTENYGKLFIKLNVQDKKINGLFISSEEKASDRLDDLKESIKEKLSQAGFETEEMSIGFRKNIQTGYDFETNEEQEKKDISTGELYKVAKTIVISIREQAERS